MNVRRDVPCSEWGRSPEWGSPQNACILWGPREGGGTTLPCLGNATPIKLYSPRALIGSVVRQKSKRPTGSVALIFANFTCSFCNSWSRKHSWSFRLLARLRFAAFACRGRLSAVCSGFGVFHVHSFWGIAPCSDFCLSRVVCRTPSVFILRAVGGVSLPLCGGIISPHPRTFNNKSAPSVAALLATLGVILYKSKVSGA